MIRFIHFNIFNITQHILILYRMALEQIPQELLLIILSLLDLSSKYSLSLVSTIYLQYHRRYMIIHKKEIIDIIIDAVSHNYVKMFKWLVPDQNSVNESDKYSICKIAVTIGGIEILKHIYKNQILNKTKKLSDIITIAAGNGHFEILKWFRTKFNESVCYWD